MDEFFTSRNGQLFLRDIHNLVKGINKINENIIKLNDNLQRQELYRALENYYYKFGDVFPTKEIGTTNIHTINIINDCLRKGEPFKIDTKGKIFLEEEIYFSPFKSFYGKIYL